MSNFNHPNRPLLGYSVRVDSSLLPACAHIPPLGTIRLLAASMEANGKHVLLTRQKPEALAGPREQAIVQASSRPTGIEGEAVGRFGGRLDPFRRGSVTMTSSFAGPG